MKVIYKSKLFKLMKQLKLVPKRFAAITLFEWILTDRLSLTAEIIFHEQRHVWQYRWHLYVFFLPIYWLLLIIYGYKNHPYERDARQYAKGMIERTTVLKK